MNNREIFEEALDYLKNNPGASFANGPSNDDAIKLVQLFYDLGAKKITTSLCENSWSENLEFTQELYLHLPEQISLDLMMEIVLSRPDEISQEDNGSIRLWCD